MSAEHFRTYLAALEQALRAGNATEHTHRPALKILLEAIDAGAGIQATNEPRRIACGAPDYIVTRGLLPLGYVEAKDAGVDLGREQNNEQLRRYRESLSNLILTDYFEFRWFLDGQLRLAASLPRPGRDGRIRFSADDASQVEQLLSQFLHADLPLKATPGDLATRMAALARLIRDLIGKTLQSEDEAGELHAQLQAFRKVLLESLTGDQFADMYAQTLAYGLFAARCNAPGQGFTRQNAANNLPRTNPFLRKLFHSIAGPDLDERIAWAVDQLAELLARADMAAILEDFGRRTRWEDPVVHFYETFLAAYDPRMREARGVYYTPEPVVGYIVRSIDELLKRDFGLPEGLAHAGKVTLKRPRAQGKGEESFEAHRLQILDPATGTGTFLYAVIAKIRERFTGNAGTWPGYVAEHLLPRLFGFELLMAPYAVAHMKLGLELQESGYDFASHERLGVFLTNSLEEAHEMTGLPLFTQWLADEAHAASSIKRDKPVMVVLGNPPYSGHSVNTGEWIAGLLRGKDGNRKTGNYFECDGAPLGERNPKWLNDDYVKFIRFAQWRIEQTGHGILGFVTNHGYLDNPTFRGMRESLLRSFDEIYLLDLHGNSKKREKAPDGGKDENVFDIQQGVAIGLFVRRKGMAHDENHRARVFQADLYGARAVKYAGLAENDVTSTLWKKLTPAGPNYYFVPENGALREEYQRGWKITDAMPVNVLGFQTHRDEFAIDFDQKRLRERIAVMRDSALKDSEYADRYDVKDNRDWRLRDARAAVRTDPRWQEKLIQVAYRPFDDRWGYFSEVAMDYPRRELLENVAGRDNLCLNITRVTAQREWRHALVSNKPAPAVFVEVKEGSTCVPLWLYPKDDLAGDSEKRFNFSAPFLEALKERINGRSTRPEDVLAYIYAVLWSPGYRARYADFLKRDFPRIPLTVNLPLFDRLVRAGHELIALHTLDIALPRITGFPVAGTNEVLKVRFTPPPADG
ncbi:MAG: N-6 DNA methylase, partial [Desulfovibrionaceae bacterium]|nr:N-6 DNA methylase [Desulfovibrionaceae bacterium]